MQYDWGLTAVRYPSWEDISILANTPGVPLEWLYAACRVRISERASVRGQIGLPSLVELGKANAASVEGNDGFRLLEAVCPYYSGPVPLWSQLWLRADPRSDVQLAEVLGVDRQKVRRWRSTMVFDPLTGARLIPNRGRPIC